MIDQTDTTIKEWAESIVDPTLVSLAPPQVSNTGEGVSLYLLDLIATPPPRTTKRPPLQLTLRYLITTWAEDPTTAHRLLGQLAFAALENADLEVEPEPPPLELWSALGVPPQPALVVQTPLRQTRPEPNIKLVRAPLVVQTVPLVSFYGRLVGPNDMPIGGARVEFVGLNRNARTDLHGDFHFAAVPSEPRAKTIVVRVKAWEMRVTTDQTTSEQQPFVIRFDPQED